MDILQVLSEHDRPAAYATPSAVLEAVTAELSADFLAANDTGGTFTRSFEGFAKRHNVSALLPVGSVYLDASAWEPPTMNNSVTVHDVHDPSPHPTPQPLAFAADEDDHCETAPEAYGHVASLLRQTATALGIHPVESLRIYDPYYCNGGVVRRLKRHGFLRVYNCREDFYDKVAKNATPDFDILLTNPPYSGDHPAKIVDFCCRCV